MNADDKALYNGNEDLRVRLAREIHGALAGGIVVLMAWRPSSDYGTVLWRRTKRYDVDGGELVEEEYGTHRFYEHPSGSGTVVLTMGEYFPVEEPEDYDDALDSFKDRI